MAFVYLLNLMHKLIIVRRGSTPSHIIAKLLSFYLSVLTLFFFSGTLSASTNVLYVISLADSRMD